MAVFWIVVPCSLVKTNRRFRNAYCLIIALMMKTVSTPETSVHFYQITRRTILEDSHLHSARHDNLKSHHI
jgi:hypothetical protein